MTGIRGLAQHLNISIGTVSRALNGKADVNPETRQRVLDAAAALGYSPNQSGRSLRHGTTNLIGVLIPTSHEKTLMDFGFLGVLDGMRQVLAARRLDLAVFLYAEEDDPFAHLRRVVERRLVDGVIIADTLRSDVRIDYLIDKAIPFVTFGRSRSGGSHPWVDIDFPGAAKQAVDHLVRLGHRRIALLQTGSERNFMGLVREAFKRALKAHGLPFDNELIQRCSHGEDSGYQGAEALLALADWPTAAITQNGNVAIGLFRRLSEAGLLPGVDVAVISLLRDTQAQFLSPALTAFQTDLGKVGAQLGQALMANLPKGAADPAAALVQSLVSMELCPGESDAAFQGTTPLALPTPHAP